MIKNVNKIRRMTTILAMTNELNGPHIDQI